MHSLNCGQSPQFNQRLPPDLSSGTHDTKKQLNRQQLTPSAYQIAYCQALVTFRI